MLALLVFITFFSTLGYIHPLTICRPVQGLRAIASIELLRLQYVIRANKTFLIRLMHRAALFFTPSSTWKL
jgi:hypothetical protein